MAEQEPKRYPVIVDELQTRARILNAAAALQDGRSAQSKSQRKLADLLLRAAMHIIGLTKKITPPAPPAPPVPPADAPELEKPPDGEGLPGSSPPVHGGDCDLHG